MRLSKQPKIRCIYRGMVREWNNLDGRYGFYCKNFDSLCYPGLCTEDWRCKKVICSCYRPNRIRETFMKGHNGEITSGLSLTEQILKWALSEWSNLERLNPNDFKENDAYKVCYRIFSNLLYNWKRLGYDHFPSKEEAIKIVQEVHPYFVWLEEQGERWQMENLYEFHEDACRELTETAFIS